MMNTFFVSLKTVRWLSYGPWSLCIVSCLSIVGCPGTSTENRPSGDVNVAHGIAPGSTGTFFGTFLCAVRRAGLLRVVLRCDAALVGLAGAFACSCAPNERPAPSVISETAKNLFIHIPQVRSQIMAYTDWVLC